MAGKKHEKVMCREVYPPSNFMWRGIVFEVEPVIYRQDDEVRFWSAEVNDLFIYVENEWQLNLVGGKTATALDEPSYQVTAKWLPEAGKRDRRIVFGSCCYTREEALCSMVSRLPPGMRHALEKAMICTSNSEHSYERED